MLKIEVIKFEAQDIITSSETHEHIYYPTDNENENGERIYSCECGDEIYITEDVAQ